MTDTTPPIRFDYTSLETVLVGVDAVSALGEQVRQRDARRVFLLVSATLSRQTPLVGRIKAELGPRFAGMFDAIRAHTPREDALQAAELARQAGADLLVSVGGGSVIDATKVVQLSLSLDIRDSETLQFYAQFADGTRGARAGELAGLTGSSLRQIAIPTTLSGAEFSCNAGVTDLARGLKEGYRAPSLYPVAILYDPQLAMATPRWLWLSTAIRSLDHAIEGFCSVDAHPYLESHFLHAISLFADSLPRTLSDPGDVQARSLNQQAVWLACCGLGRVRHGASHGIGYLLGAVCGVPHGYTSCVMLPAVLRWNESVNAQRQQAIARALGVSGMSAADGVRKLVSALELPTSLQAVGVTAPQLERVAELASRHPVVRNNPRPITGPADVRAVLTLAWDTSP